MIHYFTFKDMPYEQGGRDWGEYLREFEKQNRVAKVDDLMDNSKGHLVVSSSDFDVTKMPDEIKAKLTVQEAKSYDGEWFWRQKEIDEATDYYNSLIDRMTEKQTELDLEIEAHEG